MADFLTHPDDHIEYKTDSKDHQRFVQKVAKNTAPKNYRRIPMTGNQLPTTEIGTYLFTVAENGGKDLAVSVSGKMDPKEVTKSGKGRVVFEYRVRA